MAKSEPIDRLRNIAHCVNCFHCKYMPNPKHMPTGRDIICDMIEWGIMVQVSFEELVSNLKFAEIAYNCKYYQTMED